MSKMTPKQEELVSKMRAGGTLWWSYGKRYSVHTPVKEGVGSSISYFCSRTVESLVESGVIICTPGNIVEGKSASYRLA